MYLLVTFPIVDYFLHIYPWGIIGAAWDKLILILLAFFALRAYMNGGRKKVYPTHKMVVYMALLGLAYVLMDVGYLTVAFAGYRVDFMYMLYALLIPYVVDKDDIVPLFKFMVLGGFLLAIHGVYEYIIKAPVPAQWIPLGEHARTRVYSLFGSPNAFGSYLAFITPTAIGLALYEKDRAQRLFFAAAAVFAAMALVFTYTRGAWAAIFVAILVLTWLVDKRLTVVAIVLAVASYFFLPPIHSRLDQFLSPVYWAQANQSGRIARWANAWDQMVRNPLFGAGLGRYGGAVASQYFGVIYVDDYYGKTLAEMGLVGILSYLTLIFVYLRDVWRVWRRMDGQIKLLFAGVFSSLVALVVHNATEVAFDVPALNILFWLAGSFVLTYGAEEAKVSD